MQTISVADLRTRLKGDDEIALIDVREEGVFSKKHIFLGSVIPLSHLEFRAPDLVPRKGVPIVVTDGDGGDLGRRAAERLAEMGYTEVSVLEGGVAGWEAAGHEVFSGVNVPSKAFGEFVEHYYDTPRIPAEELAKLQAEGRDIVILDSRPMDEFNRMSIPGGVDCPGAELVYRVGTMVDDADTLVVVNCAGRTRSIIGSQSLINAGLPNNVVALKDGTMGWELAGLEVARGETRHADAPTGAALDAAKERAAAVAERFGVSRTDAASLARWQGDDNRTLFLLDVRTEGEFEDGHWPGARHAPGGQLVQATDEYVGVKGGRIVLADSADGVRATMTASWLIQLGHDDVHVLTDQPDQPETGPRKDEPALWQPWAETITHADLAGALASDHPPLVIDLANSLRYRRGHIPGARWTVRARIDEWVDKLGQEPVVLTSPDARLAHYTARELSARRPDLAIRVLEGGTDAWRASGGETEVEGIEENALTAVDDVWWKPYDNRKRVREQMEQYLTWEVGLVQQVERDGLVEFRRFD